MGKAGRGKVLCPESDGRKMSLSLPPPEPPIRHLKKATNQEVSHGSLVETPKLGTQICIRMWLARGNLSP